MSLRLEIERLRWRAGGRDILEGVSLVVTSGEFVAVLGRNGAGKSTLLDIVAGLRSADEGSVRLNGRALGAWEARDRARTVAHLPQAVRPDLPFLAGELVLMGRYPHTDRWFESDVDRAAVERAMHRTGCWDLRDRYLPTLSGGERQRVLLAACLAQDAALLLLDEPSTHLDIDQQLQCFALLAEERNRGVACVAITHDLNLALAFATRIVVIAGGRVEADLPVETAAHDTRWLSSISARLALTAGPGGRPWVSYA